MHVSPELKRFIQMRETPGGRPILEPHYDAIGKVWDIGFGHVFKPDDKRAPITEAEAFALFDVDILYYEERTTERILRHGEMLPQLEARITQWIFDALVSLVYNVGSETLNRSSEIQLATGDPNVPPKLLDYLDASADDPHYHSDVALQILTFRYARKQPIEGLLNRRAHESLIYCFGEYDIAY